MKDGQRFRAMDMIKMIAQCKKEGRLTDREGQMISSLIAQYLQLEIKIVEILKFKLNIKGK